METLICAEALDGLRQLADESCDMCVTSPPYFRLRNYGIDGQIGLENTPEEYITKLVGIFREVKRVLKPDGTLWVVIGDCYASDDRSDCKQYKPKDLIGIPWMLAFALRADGWYLRQDIIWQKTNCMPESVKDRCTKSHEYVFMLSKNRKYYFDWEAIIEPAAYDGRKDMLNKGSAKYANTSVMPGSTIQTKNKVGMPHERWRFKDGIPIRNKRSVWSVPTKPLKEAHFAPFPPDLIRPCILAGSRVGGVVLDPFIGSGTTAIVARQEQREYVGIDLNPEYIALAKARIDITTE